MLEDNELAKAEDRIEYLKKKMEAKWGTDCEYVLPKTAEDLVEFFEIEYDEKDISETKNTHSIEDDESSFENLAKFASLKYNYEKMNMPDEFQRVFDLYSEDEKKDID